MPKPAFIETAVCGKLVTMFGQPCHNIATVSKYKVVKKHCAKVVTTLSFLYGM